MKSIILGLVVVFLSSAVLYGQCPQRVFLSYSTQTDIDTFAANYPNCTTIASLRLSNSTSDPIRDLSGLSRIDTMRRGLDLRGLTALENLAGLEGLTTLGGLVIEDCPALLSTDAVSQLTTINGRVDISNNAVLADIAMLRGVDSVTQTLRLEGLPSLPTLDDLQTLSYVGGTFTIEDCDLLVDIGPFNALSYVDGGFEIRGNDAVQTVGAIDILNYLEEDLIITQNDNLVTVSGFNGLTRVEDGTIVITNNDRLEEVRGFDAVTEVDDDLELSGTSLRLVDGFNSLLSTAISFNGAAALEVVRGFAGLEEAFLIVFENCPALREIPQFASLDNIGLYLTIRLCDALVEVDGFDSLRVVGNGVLIQQNEALESLPPFISMIDVGRLQVKANPVLQSLEGWPLLADATGIEIENNAALTVIADFGVLKSILGNLRLVNNSSLINCPTLDRLTEAGSFVITGNASMQTIDTAPVLDSVSSLFWLLDCPSLTTIRGFDQLRTAGGFGIGGNAVLQQIPSFNSLEIASSYFQISGNLQLPVIDGFAVLRTSPRCQIQNNGTATITGFDSFSVGNLQVTDNPNLLRLVGFESMVEGNIDILTNEELVEMPAFGNLETSININIRGNASLEQIDVFSSLYSVRDFIIRDNDRLASIAGVESLDNAYEIYLSGEAITSIPRFDALTRLGNEPEEFNFASYTGLYLIGMESLETISGFSSLDTLAGWLEIVGNSALTRVEGFDKLSYVYRNLIFFENEKLLEVDGFRDLETIGSNYMVRRNSKLKALPPTIKLREIKGQYTAGAYGSGSLGIEGDSISTLYGLQNLTTLRGPLNIHNTNIASLRGLDNIDPSLTSLPSIRDNPRLSDCAVAFLCQLIEESTFCSSIIDNAPGCNACEEVNCLNSDIQGVVYYDYNENDTFDIGESPLQSIRVGVEPDDVELIPRGDGRYIYNCMPGETYRIAPQLGPNWAVTTDSAAYRFVFDSSEVSNRSLNFGLIRTDDVHAGQIGLTSAPTRCNTEVSFYLHYGNTGTYEESGQLVLTLDDRVTLVEAMPHPTSIDGNQLTWLFDGLQPYQTSDITMLLSMPDENSTGSLLQLHATMETTTDLLADYTYSPTVICSYDPNDKLVMPSDSTESNMIEQGQELTYTIRFQNEGNAEAIDVSIQDTIDLNLDMASLEVVASSFPVQTSITGRAVRFDFRDIWLVSARIDSIASQGFVTYRITPHPDLQPGLVIENEAFIYFDFNAPIQTNTAVSQVKRLTHTDDTVDAAMRLYPNPASDRLYLSVPDGAYEIAIYNVYGQLMYQGSDRIIDVSRWPSATYYVRLTHDGSASISLPFVVSH